ncbi:MAG: PfaD family polyunsaturated fatty acid/polyketide biosynthesis protein [Planctomycetes bacterium]|nr:PfaD family polyunsaturated fatty acid/polyketide biosynthesis protein [Planctomycetota bacterium]
MQGALDRIGCPVQLVDANGGIGVVKGGTATLGASVGPGQTGLPLVAYAPALLPERLGDPGFRAAHRLRYAYVAGAMANGVASVEIVEAMARAGMLGFFGSAGLSLERIRSAIDQLQGALRDPDSRGHLPYGFNLIHSPQEPRTEAATVDLYLARGVDLISASAYLDLTPPLVRYRVAGIHRDSDGAVVVPNKVIAKVSRIEVARKFFSPPPLDMLQHLVKQKVITQEQARMAAEVPVAEDLTAEADSGGHTDNRPALVLLPIMLALADEMRTTYGYRQPLRVGAAGGIATPNSTAAAFAMGAAYVLTGTINQACVESGTSEAVREMLARAGQADVTMAPAADMFEMGVKVQVLKWGTMFAVRARKLYDLYRTCASLADIPAAQRAALERDYFRSSLAEAWSKTRDYFAIRDPEQIARAEREPKHEMALLFRSYLGQSSHWANSGEPSRRADYQIWCGPAMGAFNQWARGSFLESPNRRDVVTVGMNLLVGAASLTRAGWLCAQGVALPSSARRFAPRERGELASLAACE